MGNNNSSDQSKPKSLLESCREVGRLTSTAYGEIRIVHDQKGQCLYAQKNLNRDAPKELIERYSRCESASLIRMLAYSTQQHKGMCTGSEETTTVLLELDSSVNGQSPQILTLADQLNERRTKNTVMSQQQILEIMHSILEGLRSVDRNGIQLRRLGSEMVLVSSVHNSPNAGRLYKLCPIRELLDDDEGQLTLADKYARKLVGQNQLVCYLGLVMLECSTLKPADGFLVKIKQAGEEEEQVFAKEDDIAKALVANKATSRELKSLIKRMVCQHTRLNSINFQQLNEALEALEPKSNHKSSNRKSLERQQLTKELSSIRKEKNIGSLSNLKSATHLKPATLSTEDESAYTHLRKAREPYLLSELFSPRKKRTQQPL